MRKLAVQSADGRLGAASEFFDLQTHALSKRDKEVGEGSVILRVMGNVVTVFVAAAGEQDRQVTPTV